MYLLRETVHCPTADHLITAITEWCVATYTPCRQPSPGTPIPTHARLFSLPDLGRGWPSQHLSREDGPLLPYLTDVSPFVFKPGDFFRDRLPPADLYVLCQIVHDWPDDKVHEILSRVAQSCKPGEQRSSGSLLR
ncbi:hypothetical protein P7K49_040847 [Saguinus oedipus]|uniref:O-methyltransferase C-terminal domain-containing protein n=1 Tax=Saguinus oedipus TaxID=9490 RepID=A0ABQ9TA83_SAGOE|nr:hypothetical protein P7K49_040847 [Saguinus oedipus]